MNQRIKTIHIEMLLVGKPITGERLDRQNSPYKYYNKVLKKNMGKPENQKN